MPAPLQLKLLSLTSRRQLISASSAQRRSVIQWLEDLEDLEDVPPPVKAGRTVVKTERRGRITLQLELVCCGKARCRCARGKGHGPYWYGYFRDGARLRSRYYGKAETKIGG